MQIDVNNVDSVYSGKDGKCCCGCAGTHYHAKDPKSARMIKKVVGILNSATDVDDLTNCVSTVVGDRLYVVHFK
jgi:hypothetical protein